MTKKEYCLSHDHIAYYSGVGGVEIHGVEGDYIYCTSYAWYPPKNIIKSKFIMIIIIMIILLYAVIKYRLTSVCVSIICRDKKRSERK